VPPPEIEPHAAAEHEAPAIVHDTGSFPETDALIWKDWPASIVMAEDDRLVMPLPAYPPEPQPVIAMDTIASSNRVIP
jgi:hypothetical protein